VTLHEHAADARDRFIRAGIPPPEAALDARLLAQFLLGWDAARFVTAIAESWPLHTIDLPARYEALVHRRERREPLAYIVGEREFWGLPFEVSPAVLIPRPETELLIETALERLPVRSASLLMADVGTGSGCLAIALAREYDGAHLVATDTSSEALEIARRNAVRLDVVDRITLVQTDLLSGTTGTFHAIVSNPPYVPDRDRETLPPEVRGFEPSTALFAGPDGLRTIERLTTEAPSRLLPGGYLLFEFGMGQAEAVEQLISHTHGLTMVDLRRDLQGIPRVAVARRT
jgi:release factor glutamine methyltransferase